MYNNTHIYLQKDRIRTMYNKDENQNILELFSKVIRMDVMAPR